jgi:Tfp pilus assembly protein PilN
MRPANLLPPDLAGGRQALSKPAIGALAAGAAVGILIAGVFVMQNGKVSDREERLDALRAELAVIPAPQKADPSTEANTQLKAEEDARRTAVEQALEQRIAWDGVLRELSLVLPEDVWLTTMSAKAPTGAAPEPTEGAPVATPQGLLLNGFTYSQEGVARLLTRLARVPQFSNVQLQSSTASEVGSRRIVGFTIAADVQTDGGESS